jgi:hypothetical protein
MKRWDPRGLMVIAPVVVGLYLVGRQLVPDADAPMFHRIALSAATLCVAVASFVASLGFGPGDYLRRAWLTNAVAFAINTVLNGLEGVGPEPLFSWLRGGLCAAANVGCVLALWIFGRALRAAGLDEIVPARQRRVGFAIAVVVALAIAGLPAYRSAAAVVAGSPSALTPLFSSLGDIAACIVLVPVLLMAGALRGGLLVWVMGFLAASQVAWLLYDAQSTVADLIGGAAFSERWIDCWLIAACALSVAAAMAQRSILSIEGSHAIPVNSSKAT